VARRSVNRAPQPLPDDDDDQPIEQDDSVQDLAVIEDDDEDELLPVVPGTQDVSATPLVAVASRPWYENLPNWIPRYIRESIIELAKVTWPTRQEALNQTVLVIIFSAVFALVFFLIDSGLAAILQAFITKLGR
jgi:preprotein translocase subunit SecE